MPYGALAPSWLDGKVIATTSHLPNNWLGLRLAIGLRRIVTSRLPLNGGLDVSLWGLRVRLHPRRNGCEKGALFTPQMFEVPERAVLLAEIHRAKFAGHPFVFVDVGANVGLFSFFVAAHAGTTARVIAIEPEPENLRCMRFNIAANPGLPIEVVPLALDDTAGWVTLDVDARDRGGTRTRRATSAADGAVIECQPLLKVLTERGVSTIDALKIDVEGGEDRILSAFFRDAPPSLWPRLIVIEDGRDKWPTDMFDDLTMRGYEVAAKSKLNVMMRMATDA